MQNLKATLIKKIDLYLSEDNTESKGYAESFMKLFSFQGAKGRERAENYKEVINNLDYSDEQLLARVWFDLIDDNSGLNGSTQLRNRIYEGLCKHFKLTTADLEEAYKTLSNNFTRNAHATLYAVPVPSFTSHQIYRQALTPDVKERLSICGKIDRPNLTFTKGPRDKDL